MSSSKKSFSFFRGFRKKLRLSARDPHTDQERWYIFLSPVHILTALLALFVVLFVVVVTIVAFTPALDLIPGYQGSKTRNMLIEYNMKLDSLENQFVLWENYHENQVRIMDGKAPVIAANPEPDSMGRSRSDVARIAEDSVLRRQMEGNGEYALQPTPSGRDNPYPEMYSPVKGVVSAKFDPRAGRFGVFVTGVENQPVMAMMDGVVIQAVWTPTEGNVIYILHSGSIISAYLHNASLTKKAGDRVYSGEVVAFTGSSIDNREDAGYTEIQLWINGTPVDPENYVIF